LVFKRSIVIHLPYLGIPVVIDLQKQHKKKIKQIFLKKSWSL
jgi:hypothetical protein